MRIGANERTVFQESGNLAKGRCVHVTGFFTSAFTAIRRKAHAHRRASNINFKMQFMLLFSRQGKLRLQKWYVALSDTQKKKISREVIQIVLARKPKMCSFLEWRDLKIVYKRYASLYFCCAVEDQENELITLEIIHRYVELLDKYFGSVCELDIIFNFEKAYYILDEFILGGEAQETSKKNVLKAIEQADMLQEEAETPRSVLEEIGLT
ncbi:AP-1 complex subunit sigma-2-like [Carassius auratus]|uniref:AP-1 complex subunit sigma-2 n=2 Tax=Carassius auratus TaxID=7957 RepID=A0A6P6QBY9_CARAU|nr:AP-1 complex subunit sigma-2-like [Carassius auratus]